MRGFGVDLMQVERLRTGVLGYRSSGQCERCGMRWYTLSLSDLSTCSMYGPGGFQVPTPPSAVPAPDSSSTSSLNSTPTQLSVGQTNSDLCSLGPSLTTAWRRISDPLTVHLCLFCFGDIDHLICRRTIERLHPGWLSKDVLKQGVLERKYRD